LGGNKGHLTCKKIVGWWRWAQVSPDGVVPSRIIIIIIIMQFLTRHVSVICVPASVNLPLHHKVQKFSSGTSSPGWYQKKGRKTVVVVVWYYSQEI